MYRYEHSSTPVDTEQLRKWLYDNLCVAGRRSGRWISAHCPLHHDENPSLSVDLQNGKWRCHAGCGSGSLTELARRAGLPSPPLPSKRKRRKPTAVYTYTDEHGQPVYRIIRYGHGSGKSFQWQHWDGHGWRRGKGDKPVYPYHLPEVLQAIERGEQILVCEGEKDVESLRERAFVATTAPGGALKWPQNEPFNSYFRGADIILCPDNDDVGLRHMEQVAQALLPYARRIRWLELSDLPPKGDVSDWLEMGHGVRDLQRAIEEAKDWQPDPRIQHAMAIMSFFRDGRLDIAAVARNIMETYHLIYEGEDEKTGTLWVYDNGVYLPNGRATVAREAHHLLGEESKTHRVAEIVNYVIRECWQDVHWYDDDDSMINCANGLLNWRTETLLPHMPEKPRRIQIPVHWNPAARCPNIEDFLGTSAPDDAIDTLIEFIGYCLLGHQKYQKALMLTGDGGDGKSKFIGMVMAFLGHGNCSNETLQDICSNRFATIKLDGKLANLYADLPCDPIPDVGVFKSIVGGDAVKLEGKFKEQYYKQLRAKLIFSANNLPPTSDVSHGWYRRWLIVPFSRKTDVIDPDLEGKITSPDELSGLLRHVVEGMRRLEARGGFYEPPSCIAAMAEYRNETDSVAAFISDACDTGGGYTPAGRLYQYYRAYCQANGYRPVSQRKFSARLGTLGHKSVHTREGNVYRITCTEMSASSWAG